MNAFKTGSCIAVTATLLGATVVYSAQNPASLLSQTPQTWESCEEMHDTYVARFVSTPGFGLSRMATPPMLRRDGMLEFGRKSYSIDSVELVGLLQKETPVVYVPARHGMKVDDTTFTSRELTAFEKGAIAGFRSGKDLASTSDEQAATLACIGSLRADASCLNCHRSKKVGDLLGAFTYRLHTTPKN